MTDLITSVKVVLAAAQELDQDAHGTIPALPWKTALDALATLREATRILGTIDASLVRHLYLTAPHGQTEIEGHGVIEVRRTQNRTKWDDRSGVHAYVSHKIDETQKDGEFPPPWDVVDWVLEVAGVGYLRTTALRAAHLTPSDFCREEPGTPTVVFRST